jgi:hypothetical protein
MRRERLLLFLGIWVAALPYLGFPYSWKNVFFTLTGFGLMYVAYTIYHENKIVEKIEETFDNFSENSDWEEKLKEVEEQIVQE